MKRKNKILWILVLIVFGSIFIKQQLIIMRLNKQYKEYSKQLDKVRFVNLQLKEKFNETKSEDRIEKLAREKLGLVKPGEILFIDKNKKR